MSMIERYVVGGFIALMIFGFVLLNILRGKIRNTRGSKVSCRNERAKSSAAGCGLQTECGGGTDVIIVGAGVAGAALAYTLGKDGRPVHVIERDLTEPDRISGEILQPGGHLKLIELGLEDCLRDMDAQPLLGYSIYNDGKWTKSCEKFQSDVSGRSFHNGRFVQRMREKAATLPNVRLEQGTVTSLISEKGTVHGVRYKTKKGEERTSFAPLTIVCDGCYSNLRKYLCTPQVDIISCMIGLILENCELPYPNHGHVIVGSSGAITFFQISSTEVRCTVDVPKQKAAAIANGEMANYLQFVVAPEIPSQLYDPFIASIAKGSMRSATVRSMPANPRRMPGAILLGDALNIRHASTAGGMTVALCDVVILRDLLRHVHDLTHSSSLSKHLQSFYILRKPMASTINITADMSYKILLPLDDPASEEMRKGCVDCLCMGGFVNSWISYMAGLNPRPLGLLLFYCYMAVNLVGRGLVAFPSPRRVWLGARFLWVLLGDLFSILKAEGILQTTFFPTNMQALYQIPPVAY